MWVYEIILSLTILLFESSISFEVLRECENFDKINCFNYH